MMKDRILDYIFWIVLIALILLFAPLNALAQEPLDTTPPVTEFRSLMEDADVVIMIASESIKGTTYAPHIRLTWKGENKAHRWSSGILVMRPVYSTLSAMWIGRLVANRPTTIEITTPAGAFRDLAGNLNVAKTVKQMRDNHAVLEKSE